MGALEAETSREVAACCLECLELKECHEKHHMRVDRKLFLARKNVKKVVRSCIRCQSIVTTLTVHDVEEIRVKHNER